MMYSLAACPFCGKAAFITKTYKNYIVDAIHDENCPLFIRPFPYDTHWVTREAAIAAWNRRRDNG